MCGTLGAHAGWSVLGQADWWGGGSLDWSNNLSDPFRIFIWVPSPFFDKRYFYIYYQNVRLNFRVIDLNLEFVTN